MKTHSNIWSSFLRTLESVFAKYSRSQVIRYIRDAKTVSGYGTILPSSGDAKQGTSFYSSLCVGKNISLSPHVDDNFFYSVMTVLLEGYKPPKKYPKPSYRDKIIAFFCCPDLNLAVPLRHGDVIIFNPRERYSLSTRTDGSDNIMAISLFTETSTGELGRNNSTNIIRYTQVYLVAGRDESIPLTEEQRKLAASFRKLADEKGMEGA